ncbi:hypothetical protein AX17_001056 [Amanita inopinata Kibby_2008]|nr:hypothetical protein AX17_001056 [Amanita inopinata Kibby_2008]
MICCYFISFVCRTPSAVFRRWTNKHVQRSLIDMYWRPKFPVNSALSQPLPKSRKRKTVVMSVHDLHEVTFNWPYTEPDSVLVTGSFDDWSKSVRLTKGPAGFSGSIKIPWSEEIAYKYYVDGKWELDDSQPKTVEPGGYVNNVYVAPCKPSTEESNGAEKDTSVQSVSESVEPPAVITVVREELAVNGAEKPPNGESAAELVFSDEAEMAKVSEQGLDFNGSAESNGELLENTGLQEPKTEDIGIAEAIMTIPVDRHDTKNDDAEILEHNDSGADNVELVVEETQKATTLDAPPKDKSDEPTTETPEPAADNETTQHEITTDLAPAESADAEVETKQMEGKSDVTVEASALASIAAVDEINPVDTKGVGESVVVTDGTIKPAVELETEEPSVTQVRQPTEEAAPVTPAPEQQPESETKPTAAEEDTPETTADIAEATPSAVAVEQTPVSDAEPAPAPSIKEPIPTESTMRIPIVPVNAIPEAAVDEHAGSNGSAKENINDASDQEASTHRALGPIVKSTPMPEPSEPLPPHPTDVPVMEQTQENIVVGVLVPEPTQADLEKQAVDEQPTTESGKTVAEDTNITKPSTDFPLANGGVEEVAMGELGATNAEEVKETGTQQSANEGKTSESVEPAVVSEIVSQSVLGAPAADVNKPVVQDVKIASQPVAELQMLVSETPAPSAPPAEDASQDAVIAAPPQAPVQEIEEAGTAARISEQPATVPVEKDAVSPPKTEDATSQPQKDSMQTDLGEDKLTASSAVEKPAETMEPSPENVLPAEPAVQETVTNGTATDSAKKSEEAGAATTPAPPSETKPALPTINTESVAQPSTAAQETAGTSAASNAQASPSSAKIKFPAASPGESKEMPSPTTGTPRKKKTTFIGKIKRIFSQDKDKDKK